MCEQAGPNPDAKQFWAGQEALRQAGIVNACSWPGTVKLEPISPWGKPRSGCESEIPTRVTPVVSAIGTDANRLNIATGIRPQTGRPELCTGYPARGAGSVGTEPLLRPRQPAFPSKAEGSRVTSMDGGRGANSKSLAATTAPTVIRMQATATDQ